MKSFKHITYKGYYGSIEISETDEHLYGEILFINDVIAYEGETVRQIRKAFEDAVDDYIETCRSLKLEPNKPFSGTFNVRLGADLHKEAAIRAKIDGCSINDFVKQAVEDKISQDKLIRHHHEHVIKREAIIEKKIIEKDFASDGPWLVHYPEKEKAFNH